MHFGSEMEAVIEDLSQLNSQAESSYVRCHNLNDEFRCFSNSRCRTVLQRNRLRLVQQMKSTSDEPEPSQCPASSLETAEMEIVHVDTDDSGEQSDPEEERAREERLEAQMVALRREHGLADERTLKKVFKLLNVWIAQYQLNKVEGLVEEVMDTCREKGGDWYVKAIQAKGFCRWKQQRLDDALELFLEQEKIVGGSAALCENIGHTYSSLGDLETASAYFTKGLGLLQVTGGGNKAGLYYGLGLIKERQGDSRGA